MVFKKIIFQNRYVALETPSRPLHGKCHLKFPFWLFDSFPNPTSIHSIYSDRISSIPYLLFTILIDASMFQTFIDSSSIRYWAWQKNRNWHLHFHISPCCCENSFKKEDFLTDFEYLSLSLCSEGREMAFVKFHTLQNITIHTFGIVSWICLDLI